MQHSLRHAALGIVTYTLTWRGFLLVDRLRTYLNGDTVSGRGANKPRVHQASRDLQSSFFDPFK